MKIIEADNYDYVLNFVIPAGATGPTGPTGPNSLVALISTYYNSVTATGMMTISPNSENLILPTNSNIFIIDNNGIILNEGGYYEFTFYGLLKDNSTTDKASLTLKVGNDNLIMIQLDSDHEIYFSRTIVSQCDSSQKVTIMFQKQDNATASAEQVYLLIQKLYF